jgi:ABC-2 type transport system ATP-binding protein
VGYLPESVGFYPDMSGTQNLRYTAELNSIPRAEANARIAELLETVELADAAAQPVGQYSRGMRQRLGLADVLLKQPRVIILDDPTLGLDPAGIEWLLGIIEELSSQRGISIFLSSHQLHEVQRVCHRVGIMSHGKMMMEGTVAELTRDTGGGRFSFLMEVAGGDDGLVAALSALPGVGECRRTGQELFVEGTQDVRGKASVTAIEHGAELLGVRVLNRSLEEIYLRYFQEGQ